ncbi:hypothetical protein FIBSPDRAFT_875386 [Athelia psychrophila]|uniref:SH3 domain-containing protein n=1 Tax=Athelia psychrophila TaxID=1759441 RepID=A0A165WBV9_9AGAM|nr:hypothetical protein FIBSPDRAFT_875386 [Fibularhizoctonia sp. CBS 109695]
MPGAHEFAVKPPPASAKGKRGSRGDGAIAPTPGAGAEQKEKNAVETPITPRPITKSSFMPPPDEMEGELEPRTPTASVKSPTSSRTASSSSEIPTPTPASPSAGPVSMSAEQDKAAARLASKTTITIPPLDASSVASLGPGSAGASSTPLTSSRPAPPSPAVSRRASGAPSNSSGRSRSSRPPSAHIPASATMTPHNRTTHLSQSSMASPVPGSPKKRRPLCVKVRDFAYPSSDERYLGLGPNTPKPNRVQVLNRFHRSRTVSGASRLSIGSLDKADFDDEEDAGDDEAEADAEAEAGADGWNGFKWGFGRLSTWGFGANGGSGPGGDDGGNGSGSGGNFPSHTDFARNFGEEAIDSSSSASDDPDDYYSGEEGAEEEPLDPGLYRAMYAFDPEGTAEMKLEEDQIVRVVGRGGGVGWAVVVRHPPGKDVPEAAAADEAGFEMERHALVPESYLELVKLDSEDQDEDGNGNVGAET